MPFFVHTNNDAIMENDVVTNFPNLMFESLDVCTNRSLMAAQFSNNAPCLVIEVSSHGILCI